LVIEPKVFDDESSCVTKSVNARDLSTVTGFDIKFVQDNQSFSKQWTLRAIYFQTEHPQVKLMYLV
jgi:dTDP-4-dehydrorhamnose 3,5-epimerase